MKDANEAPVGPAEGRVVTARYLYDRAITIYGGTSSDCPDACRVGSR